MSDGLCRALPIPGPSLTSDRGDEINTAQTARQPETGGCQDLFKFSEGKLGLDLNGNLSIITRGASHHAAVHGLEAHFHRNFCTLHLLLEEHRDKLLVVDITVLILVSEPHELLSLKLVQLNMLFDIFKNV